MDHSNEDANLLTVQLGHIQDIITPKDPEAYLGKKVLMPFFDITDATPRKTMSGLEIFIIVRSLQKPFPRKVIDDLGLLAMLEVYEKNPQVDPMLNVLQAYTRVWKLSCEVFKIRLELLRLADRDASQLGEFLTTEFPIKLQAAVEQVLKPYKQSGWYATFDHKANMVGDVQDHLHMIMEGRMIEQHVPEIWEGDLDIYKPLKSPDYNEFTTC